MLAVRGPGHALSHQHLVQTRTELRRRIARARAGICARDLFQRGDAGRGSEGISVVCTLMRDTLTPRRLGCREIEPFHDVAAARDRAARQSARDDLRHRAEIGSDAEYLLRAAR